MRKKLLFLTAVLVVGLVLLPFAVAQIQHCQCGTPKCKVQHDPNVQPHLYPGLQPMLPLEVPTQNGHRADWEFMGPEGGTFSAAATDPANPDVATILGSGGSIYTTTDGGASWTFVSLAPQYIYDFFAFDADTFYVVGYDPDPFGYKFGVTNDGGLTWTQTSFNYATVGYPYSVAGHPTDPNIIYVGSYKYNPAGPHLYYPWFHVSTDGGATFTSTDLSSVAALVPFGIAVSTSDPNVMFMAGFDYDISTYKITGMALKTTDGGATWTAGPVSPNPSEYPTMVAIDPNDDNHVVAPGTHYFESFDGGSTWTTNAYGLMYAYGIAFDPSNSLCVYVAASDGMLQTTDGGTSWTLTNLGGMAYYPAVNKGTPSTVYCACYYTGVSKTVDSGATWENVCNGILESRIYGVEVSESSPNRIYSSPYGFTAFQRSEDSGETWTEINIPPEGTYVFLALECSDDPNTILVLLPGG